MKILIADIPNTQHALDIKQSIIDGYGSDISSDIEIVSSDLQTTINSATEDTVMIVHSYSGVTSKVNMSQEVYPNLLVFMPLGSNTFTQLNLFAETNPPLIVTCGAGDFEERNNTGYGNGLEFWDEDLIWNDGDDQSSFSNGKIAGKLLKIKDTLNCDWWTARYLARSTADRNEPNRETSLWDLRNGYGKINVQAAIEAFGTVEIPEDPHLPPQLGEAGESSFVVFPDKILLSWEPVSNAEGYKVYRKYRNEAEELIATIEELFHEDVPARHPHPILYRIEAYLNEQTTEILNREIFFGVVGKVMVKGN
jgi:hypothetical protein